MRRRQALAAFEPFVGFHPFRQGAGPRPSFVAALQVGDGYFCVEYQMGISQVVSFMAKADDFPKKFQKLGSPVQSEVADLVERAKKYGATLEAIQLLGTLVPMTKKDETTMASAKLSRKDELKTAAKATPVSGKAAAAAKPAKKGNAEALAKAREAKAVNKTYKVQKKDNAGREGSWTNTMIGIAQNNTDTDGAKAELAKHKEFGDRRMDFGWLEKQGYIKF